MVLAAFNELKVALGQLQWKKYNGWSKNCHLRISPNNRLSQITNLFYSTRLWTVRYLAAVQKTMRLLKHIYLFHAFCCCLKKLLLYLKIKKLIDLAEHSINLFYPVVAVTYCGSGGGGNNITAQKKSKCVLPVLAKWINMHTLQFHYKHNTYWEIPIILCLLPLSVFTCKWLLWRSWRVQQSFQ